MKIIHDEVKDVEKDIAKIRVEICEQRKEQVSKKKSAKWSVADIDIKHGTGYIL